MPINSLPRYPSSHYPHHQSGLLKQNLTYLVYPHFFCFQAAGDCLLREPALLQNYSHIVWLSEIANVKIPQYNIKVYIK